jgi:phosphoribosylanthranilate isomerase
VTKVKICGMMGPDDLQAAKGADYLGFVVESESFRSLPVTKARSLMSSCSSKKVAVTSSQDVEMVISLADRLEPDVVQVHSPLSAPQLKLLAEECSCEVWGLVPIGMGEELDRALGVINILDALILDTRGIELGGTGRIHDWSISRTIREAIPSTPIILAGGLSPQNVADAIRSVRPYAVDVSSGVERDRKKDPELIARFIKNAREVTP